MPWAPLTGHVLERAHSPRRRTPPRGSIFNQFGVSVDCTGGAIGGVNVSLPVLTGTFGAAQRTFLVLGVDGAGGYGSGEVVDVRAPDGQILVRAASVSAALGLPVALVARAGSLTIVPHLTPRLAWGRTKFKYDVPDVVEADNTESGTRFMLGGGVGVRLDGSGIGFHLGFQRVFYKDGETLVGAGLTVPVR